MHITEIRGQLFEDHPLAPYTSWRVGGKAKLFYQPTDTDDLVLFLQQLPQQEKITWLGNGSNVLIRDGGIDGVVICTKDGLNGINELGDNIVRAEAGVSCARLAQYCVHHELSGGVFFAGIRGTVGGALAMNASAFGDETWDNILAVETIDRHGVLRIRQPEEYKVGYRRVDKPYDEWFISAQFSFAKGDVKTITKRIKELMHVRMASQPLEALSCGSVFRNPPNNHAAKLIEASGLKGATNGDAEVSRKHANFIINKGNATANELESLVERVRQTVLEKYNVKLELEVRIIGNKIESA